MVQSEQNNAAFFSQVDDQAIGPLIAAWRSEYPGGGLLALVAEQDAGLVPSLQEVARRQDYPLVGGLSGIDLGRGHGKPRPCSGAFQRHAGLPYH